MGAVEIFSLSPDNPAVYRFEVELIAGCDVEGFVPGVNVANGVASVLSGGMRDRY